MRLEKSVIGFAVADQLFVVHSMKTQGPILLQGRVFPPDPVHPGDQIFEGSGLFEVPMTDFVFFRVQVFLGTELPGLGLPQFKDRTVNPVTGAQGGGQDQTDDKGRPASELEIFRQDVRRIRPEVGSEKLPELGLGELLVK